MQNITNMYDKNDQYGQYNQYDQYDQYDQYGPPPHLVTALKKNEHVYTHPCPETTLKTKTNRLWTTNITQLKLNL